MMKRLLLTFLTIAIAITQVSCGKSAGDSVEVVNQNRFANSTTEKYEKGKLSFLTQPSDSFVSESISPAVRVALLTSDGSVDTTYTDSIKLWIEIDAGGGTTLSGTTSQAAINGIATFSNLTIDKAATGYSLRATTLGFDNIISSSFNTSYNPAIVDFTSTTLYDYGSIYEGTTSDGTFFITNSGVSTATEITTPALATGFIYKGGSFPGTGGDCSTTLAAATSCSIEVSFAPSSGGVFNDTITFSYHDGNTTQTTSRSITGTALELAEIAISDPTTYIYSNTNVGDFQDKTFVLTNSKSTNATSITPVALTTPFSFVGGSYPGTGGTCTTTLNATSSCTMTIRYAPTSGATSNDDIDLSYSNGNVTVSSTRGIQGTGVATAPTKIILDGPSAVIAGECVPYIIQSTDSLNNPAVVASNTPIAITINNGTGNFYSDSGCTSTTTSETILASTNSQTVYFSSATAPQNLTTIFTTATLDAGRKDIDIGATPQAINITAPTEITSDACVEIEVSLIDSLGNKIGSSTGENINLSQDQSLVFYSDSFCTGPITSINLSPYEGKRNIYIKQTAISIVTISATDALATLTTANKSLSVVSDLTWWDASWGYRKSIALNNLDQASSFTDIPIKVNLTTSNFTYANAKALGEDIRFILDDQTTSLSYEIEKWDPTGESTIWVKIPNLAASSELTIYMYYGNASATDSQNINNIWTTYSGVWHLGENPANTAPQFLDSTASSNHGTAEGSVSLSNAQISDGLTFSGSGDAIDVGFDLSSIIGRTSTLSFWVKTTQVGNNTNWQAPGITGVEQAGGGNDIFFGFVDASGALAINSGNAGVAKSNFIINDDAWRFITMTRDETSGNVSFYVDGVQNGSGASETGHKSTPFSKFGVISDTGGSPNYFMGTLDEIRLYTGIMSSDRIRADFKFMKGSHISFGSELSAP